MKRHNGLILGGTYTVSLKTWLPTGMPRDYGQVSNCQTPSVSLCCFNIFWSKGFESFHWPHLSWAVLCQWADTTVSLLCDLISSLFNSTSFGPLQKITTITVTVIRLCVFCVCATPPQAIHVVFACTCFQHSFSTHLPACFCVLPDDASKSV